MNTQLSPTTTTPTITPATPVQIHADHSQRKLLGTWTTSAAFEIRARRSRMVIDLRSPQIPAGDVNLDLTLDHAALTLLVAPDMVIDQWELAFDGRGKVKQTFHHPAPGATRRVKLAGRVSAGEVRVHSGGIAQLTAICSREYLADARRAHAEGGVPTLDDPARTA
ncbi:MAG TPA: hypothetical protein VFX25_29245 [Streptosporangiaceae bacterium]|nr:hypothetical protein [Streptosporangiaceae bacterium]